jgi:tripartite-type tricarboxylate transporter receptor subunit TctC
MNLLSSSRGLRALKLGRHFATLLFALVTLGMHTAALSQAYPAKPIRVIVNSTPGGLTDVVARLIGDRMSQAMRQPLVIDNRPGAFGLLGAELIARADPDGYTIGVVFGNSITSSPSLVAKPPFDPSTAFSHVVLLMSSPNVMVTNINSPYQTLAQYVADAKAKPGKISFASGGNGTQGHMHLEMLQAAAGLQLIHVPYKGGAPALNDILAGHVPAFFDTLPTSSKMIQDNGLRALGIVAPKRSPAIPNVPTFAELGYPEVRGMAWFAIVAPANTPREVVARLNEEANKVLSAPDVKERIVALGGIVEGGSPSVLAEQVRQEIPFYVKLIREHRISVQ